MRLEGIHHITAITADAQRNVDFYARVLGLRLVKKTVNFDQPDAYHLYFGDEAGSPGSLLTFFEFPGAAPGRPGAGMAYVVRWRVGSADALAFWAERLAGQGVEPRREGDVLRFADPEGLEHELVAIDVSDPPLAADSGEVPREAALRGFDGMRAYSADADASGDLLENTLEFARDPEGYEARGSERGARWGYDGARERGLPGAGTIHHIAWAARDEDHEEWRARVADAGMQVTPVIDRQYFRSIYFREPSGVLFEIATLSPGMAVDEDPQRLGTGLMLPPQHEALRPRLEEFLTPLANPSGD